MTQNPETIVEVLLSFLGTNSCIPLAFLGFTLISIIGYVLYFKWTTNKLIKKLRQTLSENPKFVKLLREMETNFADLKYLVDEAIDMNTDTGAISPRDTKFLEKMIRVRSEHNLGGLLGIAGVE